MGSIFQSIYNSMFPDGITLQLVLGNIVALVASLFMVAVGYIKDRNKMILVQTAQVICFIISNFILGAYVASIINILSLLRNLLCYKDKLNVFWKIVLSVLTISIGLCVNKSEIWGLVPIISMLMFVWLMTVKNEIGFKLMIIGTCIPWLINDTYFKAYTAAIFDVATIIAGVIAIVQILIRNKKKNYLLED